MLLYTPTYTQKYAKNDYHSNKLLVENNIKLRHVHLPTNLIYFAHKFANS